MTRPQMVRADTLDLQDQTAPSAQDHRKPARAPPLGTSSAAPHQAAELRHVREERAAEDENLSHGWQNAHNLSEEPPSDDDTILTPSTNGVHHNHHDEQVPQQNGSGGDSDTDMADAEAEDILDDDLMDKISSSPSISDGIHPSSSVPHPQRKTRMTPLASTAKSLRQNQDSCNPTHSDRSSPDSESSLRSLKRSHTVRQRPATPHVGRYRKAVACDQGDHTASSSPIISSPEHYPPCPTQEPDTPSKDHHRTGEYPIPEISMGPVDEDDNDHRTVRSLRSGGLNESKVMAKDSLAPPQQLVKSESDIALESHLLPVDDPLLDTDLDGERLDDTPSLLYVSPFAPSSSDEDEWETESESEDSIYCGNNRSNGSFILEYTDDDPVGMPTDERFIDYGWGCECLRELEDIDFEFVYALHTFVATVEGQANATKGDTMVLLDDSNSYWWLVRVVKDSTIGYLPAEHIETPTERLARLNKHRNIDVGIPTWMDFVESSTDQRQLSATMLGDTTEKSKSYLKNAMRRRNAKKVQFGGQSYVEASEHEYSSDEEDGLDKVYTNGEAPTSEEVNGNGTIQESQDQDQDQVTVAPLNVRTPGKDGRSSSPEKKDVSEESGEDEVRRKGVDESRPSDDDASERQGPSRSKLGTIRDTDSFFKDEATETRKITLTPGLLRDDGAVVRSIDGRERGGSFEILDTGKTSLEKARDDKKKKEKKPGMLSGLFKKKDKKPKSVGGETGSPQKVSEELPRDSPTIESEEASPTNAQQPQRRPSTGRLHKTPPSSSPSSPSSPSSNSGFRPLVLPSEQVQRESELTTAASPTTSSEKIKPTGPAERPSLRVETAGTSPGVTNDVTNKSRSPPSDQSKQGKVKKATTREAQEADSSPYAAKATNPFADPDDDEPQPTKQAPPPTESDEAAERLSESPVQITSADAVPDNEPPALVGDSSSNSSTDELTSLRSSPSPQQPITSASNTTIATITAITTNSSSHLEAAAAPTLSLPSGTTDPHSPTRPISPSHQKPSSPLPHSRSRSPPPPPQRASPHPPTVKTSDPSVASGRQNSTSTIASSTPATLSRTPSNSAPAAPVWNDASLRAYLDDTGAADIRELLQLVYDTSGVVPVAAVHPMVADLFTEERGKVRKLGVELDGLLSGWLERKRVRRVGKG